MLLSTSLRVRYLISTYTWRFWRNSYKKLYYHIDSTFIYKLREENITILNNCYFWLDIIFIIRIILLVLVFHFIALLLFLVVYLCVGVCFVKVLVENCCWNCSFFTSWTLFYCRFCLTFWQFGIHSNGLLRCFRFPSLFFFWRQFYIGHWFDWMDSSNLH